MNQPKNCFVMMPFSPEFRYFYLYLEQHLLTKHHLSCHRADSRQMTGRLFDKIHQMIKIADVILADCTGSNPNVLYELGIAHAYRKDLILITQDDPKKEVPTDLSGYAFIHYSFEQDQVFLEELDRVLAYVLVEQYTLFYAYAQQVFSAFLQAYPASLVAVDAYSFQKRFQAAKAEGRFIPSINDGDDVKIPFVLPKIIDVIDAETDGKISVWVKSQI